MQNSSRVLPSCGKAPRHPAASAGKMLVPEAQSCCRARAAGLPVPAWLCLYCFTRAQAQGPRATAATTVAPTAITVAKPAATSCCLCSWSSHAWANSSLRTRVSEDAAGQRITVDRPPAMLASEQGAQSPPSSRVSGSTSVRWLEDLAQSPLTLILYTMFRRTCAKWSAKREETEMVVRELDGGPHVPCVLPLAKGELSQKRMSTAALGCPHCIPLCRL